MSSCWGQSLTRVEKLERAWLRYAAGQLSSAALESTMVEILVRRKDPEELRHSIRLAVRDFICGHA